MPTVDQHMSRELLLIGRDASLAEAATQMVSRGVGAVLVVDGERLAGILTERDILKAVGTAHAPTELVGEWMTRHPETIEPGDTTEHAAVLMLHGGYRHLPVVDAGALVGMLSIRDLMRIGLADRMPRGV